MPVSICSGEGCTHHSHGNPQVCDGETPAEHVARKFLQGMPDKRNLFALNHEERRAYKSRLKGLPEHLRKTTVIKLTAKIIATDGDGTPIKDERQEYIDLRHVILTSLKAGFQTDVAQPLKLKQERYNLVKRIQGKTELGPEGLPVLDGNGKATFSGQPEEIELTEAEKNMVLDRVSKVYVQVEILGHVQELLEGGVA